MLWKLDFDEGYFRIYDSKKRVAGYLDPDYGDIYGRKDADDIIEGMVGRRESVPGCTLMVPLVKFRLFDTDLNTTIPDVQQNVSRVLGHLEKWRGFLSEAGLGAHAVRISHTDQDMLTVSFALPFSGPTPLEKKALLAQVVPVLDRLQDTGLL